MGTGLAATAASQAILARRLTSLTDLTSLNESDDAASVRALSLLARSAPVKPAAVCIWARGIPVALDVLRGSGIPVCAVTNFPVGAADIESAVAETEAAVAAGASRGDVVFSYPALFPRDARPGLGLGRGWPAAGAEPGLLDVAFETRTSVTAENNPTGRANC